MESNDDKRNLEAAGQSAEWKVYFEGGYWGRNRRKGRERAGREIRLDRQFAWGEEIWHVPAYYSCGSGLVLDFCVEIQPERLRAFLNQWPVSDWDEDSFTPEQREQIERENPLRVEARPTLYWNGKEGRTSFGSGLSWIPEELLPDRMENPPETFSILEHYGLDKTRAWSFHRWSFPWNGKRKPAIRSLRLRLERTPVSMEGIHFKDPVVGNEIVFQHPIFGTEHCLTVQEYERQELPERILESGDCDYPRYCIAMTYTLEPDLEDSRFQVRDCGENDAPRQRGKSGFLPQAKAASCIGIIGHADGPTGIILSTGKERSPVSAGREKCLHIALSALHYEPVDNVEWRLIFREKLMPDHEEELIWEQPKLI